ncbi:hypothetical protein Bca52824_033260 [Brassica carinata]|uniref:Uncharacterized protein n=1 Tax=Brassica carinata TaxID=52824 RepID=A0A8X7SCI5_BRACI|nr:hypothetical protein Bca52824_033260 [Brassica carinata]
MFRDGDEVRSVRSAPQGPSRRSWNHQMAAVQSSYDNGLKGEIRDMHHESTFAMETQVVKIEKSHKEASKGTPRRVRLDEDDQDDHNELALFLDIVLLMISVLGLRFLMMGYSTALTSHLSDLHEKFPDSLAS